ncbi:hypothetical protein ABTH51_19770, partial [Acinetobacter baumannii]
MSSSARTQPALVDKTPETVEELKGPIDELLDAPPNDPTFIVIVKWIVKLMFHITAFIETIA